MPRVRTFAGLVLALWVGLSGCTKRTPPPPQPPPPAPARAEPSPPAPARIQSFTVEPPRIERGQSAVLRWSVGNATNVAIDGGVGVVPSAGTHTVDPSVTSRYTLTASGPGGSDTRSVTLEVVMQPPPSPPSPTPPVQARPNDVITLVVRVSPDTGKRVGRMTPLDLDLSKLPDGAYRWTPPPGSAGGAELLIDTKPLFVTTAEEEQKALAQPGFLKGIKTKVSDTMRAVLSGLGMKITPLYPSDNSGQQPMSAQQPARWWWEVADKGGPTAMLILDIQARLPGPNGRWVSVGPPITHSYPASARVTEASTPQPQSEALQGAAQAPLPTGQRASPTPPRSGAPESSSPKWIIIASILAVAMAGGSLLTPAVRKKLSPMLGITTPAAVTVAPLKTRVLVVHGRDERSSAEKFCRGLNVDTCEFVLAFPGFPPGSLEWQQHFLDEYGKADAILVLLTGAALGEEGVNWQITQASSGQAVRRVPIYPVILDERVSRAASTLNRLSDLPWFNARIADDMGEVSTILSAVKPSAARAVRCFLSYSRKDGQELANRLIADLQARGIHCWRDTADIPGGTEWEKQIASAIDSSTHVLIVISPKSLESPHVGDEITYAREKSKVVIPLLSEELPLPFGLHRIQAIGLFADYESGFERLVRDLTSTRASARAGAA